MNKNQETIELLRQENEEFRKLEKEHRELDDTILSYSKLRFLSTDQDIEKKRLQKLKLYKKDKMAEMIRQYQNEAHHN